MAKVYSWKCNSNDDERITREERQEREREREKKKEKAKEKKGNNLTPVTHSSEYKWF